MLSATAAATLQERSVNKTFDGELFHFEVQNRLELHEPRVRGRNSPFGPTVSQTCRLFSPPPPSRKRHVSLHEGVTRSFYVRQVTPRITDHVYIAMNSFVYLPLARYSWQTREFMLTLS